MGWAVVWGGFSLPGLCSGLGSRVDMGEAVGWICCKGLRGGACDGVKVRAECLLVSRVVGAGEAINGAEVSVVSFAALAEAVFW